MIHLLVLITGCFEDLLRGPLINDWQSTNNVHFMAISLCTPVQVLVNASI